MNRILHQDLELVPILRKQLEFEIVRNARRAPRLCDRLEPAHHEAADFLLVVDEAVRVAYDGERGRHARDCPGHDVEVLGGIEGHVDAGHAAELACPLAAAVHQRCAGDVAFVVGAFP